MNGDVDSRMNNLMKVCGCEERILSIKQKKCLSDFCKVQPNYNDLYNKSVYFLDKNI